MPLGFDQILEIIGPLVEATSSTSRDFGKDFGKSGLVTKFCRRTLKILKKIFKA